MPAVRPTMKQKKALDLMVEDRRKPLGQIMVEAGYSPATAVAPQKLTESDGFKMLLEQAGLTPGLIVNSLVEDIKKKPQKRIGELSLGADILGLKKRADTIIPIQINFSDERGQYT